MRIGVDLGGTKIEAVVMAANGELLFRERVPTPQDDYAGVIEAVASLVERLEGKWGQPCKVGIGTPGAESRHSGLMKNCNNTCLNGRPLRQDIGQRLHREVRLANDANCFALSEAVDGSAAGFHTVFGVILGTGVGGGIVVDKAVLNGANAIAGEWGHNPLSGADQQRPCYCGRHDCIETHLCGAGLLASYRQRGGDAATARQVVDAAEAGQALAAQVVDEYCRKLARALAGVINVLDPDAIVLGGGLSNMQLLYQRVPEYWGQWVFTSDCQTRLLSAKYGDSSGVRGAAWLW